MEENLVKNRSNNASLNPYSAQTNYKTGYENVDNLTAQGNELINNSVNTQMQAIDQGVTTNINELNRQKQKQADETLKNNKAYYQQYQKAVNPYGVNQEALASQGLGHSGIAESTKTSIYNQYQKSVTESLNNLRQVSADYDAQMAEVRSNGDIAKAEAISNAYLQQLEQIKYAYTLAEAQKEFEYKKSVDDRNYNYQLERDRISDQRYADEWAYQKERDAIADEQWRQEFEASRRSSGGGGYSSGGGSYLTVNDYDESTDDELTVSDTDTSQDSWVKRIVKDFMGKAKTLNYK